MTRHVYISNLYPIVVMLVVFTILAGLAGALLAVVNARKASDQRMAVSATASIAASSIERQITHYLSATYTLAISLKQTRGSSENFETTAAELMQLYHGIDSFQLAPMGVVSNIYPLNGNEAALGHNLLEDPQRRTEALKAIRTQSLTLAGPFELHQGGQAVVGRLPIFLPRNSGKERFWGFTVAVIKLEKLFGQIDLATIFGPEYAYCLYRRDPDSKQKHIITASTLEPLNGVVEVNITVPNGKWILAVKPLTTWGPPLPWSTWIIAFSICALISFMVYIIVKQNKQIANLALHDSLTGLPNRMLFSERAKLAIAQARRHNKLVALIFIDVDNFKMVNDLFGHDAGDQLLCLLSERLTECVRDIDTLARIGGDEFLLILTHLDKRGDAEKIAEKLKKMVEKPFALEGQEVGVSISLGISFYPDDGDNLAVLKSKADTAMYKQKKNHKGHREPSPLNN